MLIYEVNLKVNPEIKEKFLAWLKPHMHEVVECGRFESGKLFTTEEGDLTMHYYVKDRTTLDVYLKNHAPRLRENGLKAFPNQFTATRRILNRVH